MADETKPAQPSTEPEEGELRDEELDAVTGGEKSPVEIVTETNQKLANIYKAANEMVMDTLKNVKA
jgi:hypothetical protein